MSSRILPKIHELGEYAYLRNLVVSYLYYILKFTEFITLLMRLRLS